MDNQYWLTNWLTGPFSGHFGASFRSSRPCQGVGFLGKCPLPSTPVPAPGKFYASMRFDVRRIGQVKIGDEPAGGRTRVKVAKNKCNQTAALRIGCSATAAAPLRSGPATTVCGAKSLANAATTFRKRSTTERCSASVAWQVQHAAPAGTQRPALRVSAAHRDYMDSLAAWNALNSDG
jgi:hypothetical protein